MKALLSIILICSFLAAPRAAAFGQAEGKSSAAPAQNPALPKDLNVEETAKLLAENKKVIVLDIRTPKEFAEGHIAGAKNINFYDADFQKRLGELDKGQSYLVHCAAGSRSAKARDLMKKLEFRSIYHFKDGFRAWEKAGKPVTKE